jgi:hypothetical protein
MEWDIAVSTKYDVISISRLNKQNRRKLYRWYLKNIYNMHKCQKEKGGKRA